MTITEQLAAALREIIRLSEETDELTELSAKEIIEALVNCEQTARAALAAYDARPAADANEAELADLALDYLHLAQPEFCSMRCPSVGREGTPIPHLPECVSMRSLLDGLPFATPGATISTGLISKLKKLANYLTDKGEYEATDLIDTVVDRLSADPQPAADDGAVERVARALSQNENGAYTPNYSWELVPEVLQDAYRSDARAALAALEGSGQ